MSRLVNGIIMALLLVILMIGAYLQGGLHGFDARSASVFSAESYGRSVAFELFSDLGFGVQAWTQAPAQLPQTQSLFFVSAAPVAPEHYGVAEAQPEGAALGSSTPRYDRIYDPAHYRSFVEQGGTLVLSAESTNWRFLDEYFGLDLGVDSLPPEVEEQEQGFLSETLKDLKEITEGLEDEGYFEDIDEEQDSDHTFLEVEPADAPGNTALNKSFKTQLWADSPGTEQESLSLAWRSAGSFVGHAQLEPLALDEDGALLAASLKMGEGQVVLLESDRFLDNDWIGEAENALFAVRLAERFAADRKLYFDEYTLGGWTPESPLDLAFAEDARPLTLHLMALLTLVVWLGAWVRWFPRDPEPLAAVSAQIRARGLAGMLMRSKRWELLGQMLRLGVLRRLARRTGQGKQRLAGEEEALQEPQSMRAVLTPILRNQSPERMQQALALLGPGRLRSRKQLDELARDLAALELGTLESNTVQAASLER